MGKADGGGDADKDGEDRRASRRESRLNDEDAGKLNRMRSAMLTGDSDILGEGATQGDGVEPNSVAASLARMRSAMLDNPSEEGEKALERRASRRGGTASKADGADKDKDK